MPAGKEIETVVNGITHIHIRGKLFPSRLDSPPLSGMNVGLGGVVEGLEVSRL